MHFGFLIYVGIVTHDSAGKCRKTLYSLFSGVTTDGLNLIM